MLNYKKEKLKALNLKYYTKWDFEAIKALHDLVLVQKWSLNYALRLFAGSHQKFHFERKRNYFLGELYKQIQAEQVRRREEKKAIKC